MYILPLAMLASSGRTREFAMSFSLFLSLLHTSSLFLPPTLFLYLSLSFLVSFSLPLSLSPTQKANTGINHFAVRFPVHKTRDANSYWAICARPSGRKKATSPIGFRAWASATNEKKIIVGGATFSLSFSLFDSLFTSLCTHVSVCVFVIVHACVC